MKKKEEDFNPQEMQKQVDQMLADGTMPSPEEFARMIEGVRGDYRSKLRKLRSNETAATSKTARRPRKTA